MSDELDNFDEDLDNPFALLNFFGWCISEQEDEDDDNEQDEDDWDDWDDDVYCANVWFLGSSLGDWGQFAGGLAWDGSRDHSNDPQAEKLSLFEHFRLVMDTRREERFRSRLS